MTKNTWQLYSNEDLLINNEDADILFGDEEIIYIDEYGRHIINRRRRTYQRVGEDNEMIIDFKRHLMIMLLDGKELRYDIKAKYKEAKGIITLTYNLGDEEKKIVVKRGE